jgi:hypothetical protein
MQRMLVLGAAAIAAASVSAHEGHGAPTPHLHGPEWTGLALAGAIAAGLWWWSRRGR